MESGSRSVLVAAMAFLVAGGCDSGTSSTPIVASDFDGTWSGTCTVSGAQAAADVPFRLDNLAGMDDTGVVFGSLDSAPVAGAFAGTVDGSGTVVGTVDNTVDGMTWTASLEMNDAGIALRLDHDGVSLTGQGAASAPANGINYKITVTNAVDREVPVTLYTSHLFVHAEETVWVKPGDSYTYETGAYCPMGIMGYLPEEEDPEIHFRGKTCRGEEGDTFGKWSFPCCASSQWRVEPNTNPKDRYCTGCPDFMLTKL